MCFLKVELQDIIACVRQGWSNGFSLEKKMVTDALYVKTIVGFDASHRMCANLRNAIWIAKFLLNKLTS